MSYKPGTRVFAVLSANEEQVLLLGFGTYMGDHPRGPETFPEEDYKMAEEVVKSNETKPFFAPETVRQHFLKQGLTPEEAEEKVAHFEGLRKKELATPVRERAHELLCKMNLNPKIELDNGDIVWGYQCWWGPEEKWSDEFIRGREVKEVSIEDYT